MTSHTTIGKYIIDETIPSIEAAKNLAKILDTTVGYLLGETQKSNLFKDPKMLKRLHDFLNLPENERLLLYIDHFIKAAKISLM